MERICQICKRRDSEVELIPASVIRPAVKKYIVKNNPSWLSNGFVCVDDLKEYRYKYVEELVQKEKGELTDLEKEVLKNLSDEEILSKNIDDEYHKSLSFGQQLSDRIASFGGSWKFIIIFLIIMIFWIALNSILLIKKHFDPYPYILLNLLLSCLAAMQAPIIMMSQNRQEAKDRARGEHDYKTNLKAELEIRQLHQKIDHLLIQQWERMIEIQELQIELLEELRKNLSGGTKKRSSGERSKRAVFNRRS